MAWLHGLSLFTMLSLCCHLGCSEQEKAAKKLAMLACRCVLPSMLQV